MERITFETHPEHFTADGSRLLTYSERVERRRVATRDAKAIAKQASEAAAPTVSDTDRKMAAASQNIDELKSRLDHALPADKVKIKRRIKRYQQQVDGWRDEQKQVDRQRAFDSSREAKLARDAIDSCCAAAYPHARPESIALVKALGEQDWDTPEAMYQAVFEKIEQLADESLAVEQNLSSDLEHQRLAADASFARQKAREIEAQQLAENVREQQ